MPFLLFFIIYMFKIFRKGLLQNYFKCGIVQKKYFVKSKVAPLAVLRNGFDVTFIQLDF